MSVSMEGQGAQPRKCVLIDWQVPQNVCALISYLQHILIYDDSFQPNISPLVPQHLSKHWFQIFNPPLQHPTCLRHFPQVVEHHPFQVQATSVASQNPSNLSNPISPERTLSVCSDSSSNSMRIGQSQASTGLTVNR